MIIENSLPELKSTFTVDCLLFGFDGIELKVLLIERNKNPFKDWWALPGFFVEANESIDQSASRILYELTGLRNIFMQQYYTFGDVDRHPQGRVISIAYYAVLRLGKEDFLKPVTSYARDARWVSLNKMPKLAFDHQKMFDVGLEKVRRRIKHLPIAFELLPLKFTLSQLQQIYEIILDKQLDKRNFRKKMLSFGILKPLGEKQKGVSFRAAALYKFDKKKYAKLFGTDISF